jgi:uncharacterized membrane protein
MLAASAIVWAMLLPVAAAAATEASPGVIARSAVFLVYGVGRVVCHQRPERSFHWGAASWPVCARCTGVYAGAAIVAFLLLAWRLPSMPTPERARWWLALGAWPAAASLAYEWVVGVMPSHVTRMVTGVPLGATLAVLVLAVLSGEVEGLAHRTDEVD